MQSCGSCILIELESLVESEQMQQVDMANPVSNYNNWAEWSTIQGVIRQFQNLSTKCEADLKLLTQCYSLSWRFNY